MNRLSEEAKSIYFMIQDRLYQNNRAPTIQEIVAEKKLSTRKVLDALRELEDSLIIKRSQYRSRSIEIISPIQDDGKIDDSTVSVPILGTAPGGPFLYAEQIYDDHIKIPKRLLKGNTEDVYLLRMVGNSMSSYLDDGDLALVKKSDTANQRDVIVAVCQDVSGDYQATIKEFIKNGNQVILNPLNRSPEYEPIVGNIDEIKVQGIVIGAIKMYQKD